MRFEKFVDAAAVYDACMTSEIRTVRVSSDPVTRFSAAVDALGKRTRDMQDDDYWVHGLSSFRRRRFLLRATPLNAADPALELLAALSLARAHFENCAALYPEASPLVEAACETLMDVVLDGTDALSESVAEVRAASDVSRVGVVLATFGFDRLVQQHLRRRTGDEHLSVVTPRELFLRRPYELLIVIGAPGWYVRKGWASIYTVPRAPELVVMGYDRDATRSLPAQNAFSESRMALPQRIEGAADVDEHHEEAPDFEFDWRSMSDEFARRASESHAGLLVEARLFLLANGFATFLSASAESRVPTLEPDAVSGERIAYLPSPDLEAGAFVLLRSQGGGDLIVAVADSLLGKEAAPLRTMQAEWKTRLRQEVDSRGSANVIMSLKQQGSSIASRSNLVNWCSPRSLRTWKEDDFVAIMRVVGLEDQADRYWHSMAALESAHRQAGFAIREQLETQAEEADITLLEEAGTADFTLADGGGALTAYRVEEISPLVVEVPDQNVGQPFKAVQ